MSIYDKIYRILPVPAQNIVVSVYGLYWYWLRFSGNYKTFEQGYLERDRYSQQQWSLYQTNALKNLLADCINEIPYYQKNWNEQQKQAALSGNLQGLPLLNKEPIRANPHEFTRQGNKPFPEIVAATSGSTGTPVKTLWTVSEVRDSLAVREVRSARWAGVSFKMPRATFSGRMVEPDPDSEGPYYRFNWVEKQVYFSAFHLKPETAHFYVNALKKHHIEWMTGYAVSFYLLAKFILEKNLEVPPLKAVITTSEKLTPEMRSVMEKAYSCRIYEEYSTVENALFVSECEQGRLHVSPDVGIVEILKEDGSPCQAGEIGEVVTTCLMRSHQVFIRFRLGDLAAWDSDPCPCGRQMPVIKEVIGRLEDVVIGPDGRQMVRFHGIFVNQPHIIEGQIIQEELELIRVVVVPTDAFTHSDVLDIENRIHQRLGYTVKVIVETVNQIPRTKAGKFKAVVSNLSNENLE